MEYRILSWSHRHDVQRYFLSASDPSSSSEERWAAAVQRPGGPDPDLHQWPTGTDQAPDVNPTRVFVDSTESTQSVFFSPRCSDVRDKLPCLILRANNQRHYRKVGRRKKSQKAPAPSLTLTPPVWRYDPSVCRVMLLRVRRTSIRILRVTGASLPVSFRFSFLCLCNEPCSLQPRCSPGAANKPMKLQLTVLHFRLRQRVILHPG